MNCPNARMAAVERGLGLLAPLRAAALDAHLDRCPACASALRAEERLVEELGALGRTPPLAVDVTARVLGGIGPVPREDVPARQLGWAGAAAALCTAVAVGALAGRWEQVETLLVSGAKATSKLLGFADALVTPLASLLAFVARLLGAVGQSIVDLAAHVSGFEPLAWGAVWLGYGVMAATVVLVLLRDLRRPAGALPRGRM